MATRVLREGVDTLDWERIGEKIEEAAISGLSATARFTHEQAERYVPVRDVFARSRGRLNRNPYYSGGANRRGQYRVEGVTRGVKRSGNRWRSARRVYDTEKGQQEFLKQFHRQRPRNRQITAVMENSERRVRGHERSYNPVVGYGEETEFLQGRDDAGSFPARRISSGGGFQTITKRDVQERGQRARDLGVLKLPSVYAYSSSGGPRKTTVEPYLSYKGRKEVRRLSDLLERMRKRGESIGVGGTEGSSFGNLHERLTQRGPYPWEGKRKSKRMRTYAAYVTKGTKGQPGEGGQVMLGGRLRDSITVGKVEESTSEISVEVYTDPEQQDYAAYQEYGTSRHPAQPFMRPALYESRQRLGQEVSKALRKKFT